MSVNLYNSRDHFWRSPSRKLPDHIAEFLAENGIPVPPAGQHIDIGTIDRALSGESIEDRITAKSHLRSCDLIAP
jgi:hypothetical protein